VVLEDVVEADMLLPLFVVAGKEFGSDGDEVEGIKCGWWRYRYAYARPFRSSTLLLCIGAETASRYRHHLSEVCITGIPLLLRAK
jgi:hypothetical protein